MKHYTLWFEKNGTLKSWDHKAEDSKAAKLKAAQKFDVSAETVYIKKWCEKGPGGRVVRERNYNTPLG